MPSCNGSNCGACSTECRVRVKVEKEIVYVAQTNEEAEKEFQKRLEQERAEMEKKFERLKKMLEKELQELKQKKNEPKKLSKDTVSFKF